MIKVVYPLINMKSKKESGWYTMTYYDIYKYKGTKYVKGDPLFYTDEYISECNYYIPMEYAPLTIEESDNYKEWKCSYAPRSKSVSNVDYIAGAVSYSMLTKK